MNDIFNFRRFRQFFMKSVLERPAQILGTVLLSFAVVVMLYFLLKSFGGYDAAQLISFTIGLVGGGCLLASQVFGYFSDMAGGASYLTLPVSTFEKWLSGFLLMILFLGIYLLFYRAVDLVFIHFYHASLNPLDPRYKEQYEAVYAFTYFGESLPVFIFFLNAAGAMLVGSLYFNKVNFIKVALILCGLFLIAFVLNYMIGKLLFKDLQKAFPFHMITIKNRQEDGVVNLSAPVMRAYDIIVLYILPAILLFVSYIRLKEKEL